MRSLLAMLYVSCPFANSGDMDAANVRPCSEIAFSTDDSVQVYDAVGCHDKRSGRQMGVQSVMVFSKSFRATVCVHLRPGQ